MSTFARVEDLHWLEDMLLREGVYSLCRDVEADILRYRYRGDPEQLIGDPALAIVISSLDEIPLVHRVLRRNSEELRRKFGQDVVAAHEAWPFFFIYLELNRISTDHPESFFLSTKIVSSEVVAGTHRVFDIQITLINSLGTPALIQQKRNEIRTLLNSFNERSRYLKVRNVETTFRTSKFGRAGEAPPVFDALNLN